MYLLSRSFQSAGQCLSFLHEGTVGSFSALFYFNISVVDMEQPVDTTMFVRKSQRRNRRRHRPFRNPSSWYLPDWMLTLQNSFRAGRERPKVQVILKLLDQFLLKLLRKRISLFVPTSTWESATNKTVNSSMARRVSSVTGTVFIRSMKSSSDNISMYVLYST